MGGPHPALVDVALSAGNVAWKDVNIVWVPNLTGKDSPAELLRKDPSIDWVCVISPDMLGLTGGIKDTGSGAEGTVKGAHVVVSTADATQAIADVYAVRKDYLDAHRAEVMKFVAAYLTATNELMAAKKEYNDGKGKSALYVQTLQQAQSFYGKEVLPTIEVDAHGLVSDAIFVGLPGNISFFTDAGNLNGFNPRLKKTLDLLTTIGLTKERVGFDTARWDWPTVAKQAGIAYTEQKQQSRISAESVELFPDSNLDERTIAFFTIQFEPNQQEFSLDTYAADFEKVVQQAQTFGNCVVAIRGHADPTKTLVDFLKAGMATGLIKRTGSQAEGYQYFYNNKPLDLNATADVLKAIESGDFGKTDPNPQDTLQAALNLSHTRADQVKKAVVAYAKTKGYNLDPSQIQPVGVGIREPIVAKPRNMDEAKRNMRVEFRLTRIPAEAIKGDEFDLLGGSK